MINSVLMGKRNASHLVYSTLYSMLEISHFKLQKLYFGQPLLMYIFTTVSFTEPIAAKWVARTNYSCHFSK